MRPFLPLALALSLAAPLSHAADSSSASTKAPKTTRDDSEDGDGGKSPGFFGRLFGKPPEPQAAPVKKSTSSASSKGESKNDPKAEVKGDAKVDSKTAKKTSAKDKTPAPSPDAPKTDEERFILAKKAASEDPKIVELRNKADGAVANSDANRLTRAYLKAMYAKMRTLEPTMKDRIDLTETAALRLLPE